MGWVAPVVGAGVSLFQGIQGADAAGKDEKRNAQLVADVVAAQKKKKQDTQRLTMLGQAFGDINRLQAQARNSGAAGAY